MLRTATTINDCDADFSRIRVAHSIEAYNLRLLSLLRPAHESHNHVSYFHIPVAHTVDSLGDRHLHTKLGGKIKNRLLGNNPLRNLTIGCFASLL